MASEDDPDTFLDQEPQVQLTARPEQMSAALRAALTVVAPDRLAEIQRTKDAAFAKALEWQSLSPVRSWALAWARDIEIARRPDPVARNSWAKGNLEHEDADVAREALRELSAVLDEALKAVHAQAGPWEYAFGAEKLPAPPRRYRWPVRAWSARATGHYARADEGEG
ncbi:hypothetical protein ACFV1R_21950 [Streptomyces coelicoflavus]|uniref:hypothetical protein n=1 Tax=Streptomyces coelicoflavus TaxID=285562 RepID=UPI0036B11881